MLTCNSPQTNFTGRNTPNAKPPTLDGDGHPLLLWWHHFHAAFPAWGLLHTHAGGFRLRQHPNGRADECVWFLFFTCSLRIRFCWLLGLRIRFCFLLLWFCLFRFLSLRIRFCFRFPLLRLGLLLLRFCLRFCWGLGFWLVFLLYFRLLLLLSSLFFIIED